MSSVSLPRRIVSAFMFFTAVFALAAESPKKMFDIPAGPAERTLRRFTEQSGLQIGFPSEVADGVRTNAIKGEMTPLAAADELFAGTNLRLVLDAKTGAYSVARTPVTEKNGERAAQTAASDRPVPTAEAVTPSSQQLVELTPFEVRTDRDEGYLANNTLSGSRLNTALKDTPASINVFTKEFMQDIGAFNLDDVLQYGMNLQFDRDDAGGFGDSPNGNNTVGSFQGYRVRGVNISLARNYFTSGGLPRDTFNVERVEQSRGPNSVLFGIGSAGGVVNISNKEGIIGRSFQNIRASAGSYGSWRTELDINQSLSNKIAARLNLVRYRAGTYRLFQDGEGYAGHLALKYRVLPRVEIRGELERGHLRDNSPRNTALLDFNSYWLAAGRPLLSPTDPIPTGRGAAIGARLSATTNGASLRFIQNPGETTGRLVTMANQIVTNGDNIPVQDDNLVVPQINTQGPTADRIANYTTGSAFVNVELVKNAVYVEAAFNHEQLSRPVNYNATQSERFRGDPNTTLPGTLGPNPYAGAFFTETNWQIYDNRSRADRGRVSISAEHDFGKWGMYRAAVLGEMEQRWSINSTFLEVYAGRPFNSVPENAANQVIRRAYFVANKWDTYYETGPGAGLIKGQVDPISGRTLSSELVLLSAPPDVRYLQKGLLGALQASYFKKRLVIGTGIRRDLRDDFTRAYVRDPVTNALVRDVGKGADVKVAGRTYTLGAVLHITKNLDLIYNRSDNFNLPTAGQQVLITGSGSPATVAAPNPAGKAQEYGVAITLLDGKLYGRAIHYATNTVDQFSFQGSDEVGPTANQLLSNLLGSRLITQADYDAHATKNTGYLSDRSADGYEFQLTANPTKNWRFTGSFAISNASASGIRKTDYAYWEATKKYLGQFTDRVGLGSSTTTMAQEIAQTDQTLMDSLVLNGGGLVGNRKYLSNFFTRYSFSTGWLKGAWVGGGYNWKSKMLIGRNTSLAGLSVEQQLQWSAPVGEGNAALGYTLRVFDKHPINLSLNVRNLFDETAPIITRRSADAAQIIRRMIYRAPRSWQLTADYKF